MHNGDVAIKDIGVYSQNFGLYSTWQIQMAFIHL